MSIRWDRLFADLEGQLEAAARAELAAEVADRTRYEVAQTQLLDRLRAMLHSHVELTVAGVGPVAGTLARVGADFVLLEAAGSLALIRAGAVVTARNLAAASRSVGEVAARIAIGMVVRELARDRAVVTVWLVDGTTLAGTVDRVGADYIDVAEHCLDEPRRAGSVQGIRTVALGSIAMVRAS
jgi:hypothetical protein